MRTLALFNLRFWGGPQYVKSTKDTGYSRVILFTRVGALFSISLPLFLNSSIMLCLYICLCVFLQWLAEIRGVKWRGKTTTVISPLSYIRIACINSLASFVRPARVFYST